MSTKYKHKRYILSIDGEIHSSYLSVDDARFELPHIKPHFLDAKRFSVVDSKTGKEMYHLLCR